METESKEPTGVTRGLNAVHLMPFDWSAAERVLGTLVDRLDAGRADTQLLIITPDAEGAAAAAGAVVQLIGTRPLRVIAATASARTARLQKGGAAQIVAGAPAELAALLQSSALKPEHLRAVVFAWLDPILGTPDAQPLETLLGELPKEGARVVLAAESTPALEALIERYARRARRAPESAEAGLGAPLNVEYVATATSGRASTLRRLLDALDLPRAMLYARSPQARHEAATVARALGYPADAVRLSGEGEQTMGGDPLVMLELPTSSEELRALVGTTGRRLYALVQPSQIGSLRSLLAGGTVAPVVLIDAAERARGRDAALRAALRDVLTSADVRREVLALEPLLAEFDGVEIAAAALRMLEQYKPARPVHSATHATPMQKLFVNLGDRDGIRAQEIIASISAEAGIPASQVGKVEVRDTHSLVEVAASVAGLVVEKITGASVRGRRVQARLDTPREDRPERGGPPGRGPAGDRPRSFDRGPRSGARSGAPARGDRPDRSGRPARPAGAGPRPFDRGDAGSRPARPPRPPRPRRDDA